MFAPLLNKEKPLDNVLNQSKTPVPISLKKPLRVAVNESIDYEATSNYGFDAESRKRSLNGRNRKAKKQCADISITDLFGDHR